MRNTLLTFTHRGDQRDGAGCCNRSVGVGKSSPVGTDIRLINFTRCRFAHHGSNTRSSATAEGYSEYIVGGWPSHIFGAIGAVATV